MVLQDHITFPIQGRQKCWIQDILDHTIRGAILHPGILFATIASSVPLTSESPITIALHNSTLPCWASVPVPQTWLPMLLSPEWLSSPTVSKRLHLFSKGMLQGILYSLLTPFPFPAGHPSTFKCTLGIATQLKLFIYVSLYIPDDLWYI